jgi:hypothetical protein
VQLENGLKLRMWLWIVTVVDLDENEDEKWSHIIQQLMAFNDRWKFSCICN